MVALALDIGETRIGIAVSSRDGKMAMPVKVLPAAEVTGMAKTFRYLVEDYEPDILVSGRPLTMAGEPGPQAERVAAVAQKIADELDRSIGGAMDAKQLEKMMGFAPGELKKAAEAYEKDEWPKGHTIKLGRPPISDEPSVVISARVGESILEAFDEKAKRHGQTRTERLRELITLDALIA